MLPSVQHKCKFGRIAMKPIVRLTALVVVVALSLAGAPRNSFAGTDAPPTAKTCFFVRNHLPCPCGRGSRALVRAAFVTAGALGNAIGTTTSALAGNHTAPRNASQAVQSPKR
jgi:hypothetical protein